MAQLPKTLRAWCDRHAHQVSEVTSGGGYAGSRDFAYEVSLKAGWCVAPGEHIAIESNMADMLSKLRGITPCDCVECRGSK